MAGNYKFGNLADEAWTTNLSSDNNYIAPCNLGWLGWTHCKSLNSTNILNVWFWATPTIFNGCQYFQLYDKIIKFAYFHTYMCIYYIKCTIHEFILTLEPVHAKASTCMWCIQNIVQCMLSRGYQMIMAYLTFSSISLLPGCKRLQLLQLL